MKNLSIYSRVVLVMALSGAIILLLFSTLYYIKFRQEKLIIESSQEQFSREVTSILALKGESLKQVAYDYTFWDEFIKSIASGDTFWFNENISSILSSFHFDYVCVTDKEFNTIHEASNEGLNGKGIITKAVFPKFNQSPFVNFFVSTPEGLFEVSGASIHPTNDPTHTKSKASGYLFVAKAWNKDLLTSLSSQTGADARLLNLTEPVFSKGPYYITVTNDLAGMDNNPIKRVAFSREYHALKLYHEISQSMLVIIFISFLFAFFLFRFIILRFITRPLMLVSSILETENDASVQKLQKGPGEFQRIGVLFKDYIRQKTELVAAKDSAERADRMKTEFVHNLSHEIRTPMNGIMGFCSLLNEPTLNAPQRLEYTNIIIRNSGQLLRVIDDILEISSLETKQVRIQNSEILIYEILSDVYENFSQKAKEKDVTLRIENYLPPHYNKILLDESKLLKILNNLVENALKFTITGYVEIGCKLYDGKIQFHVKDSGIGIAKEKFQKIFERFSQADDTISNNYGGLGLGLSIARENAELLGSKIFVHSEPGIGSDFYFSISFNPVPEVKQTVPVIPATQLQESKHTILIAEDEATNYRYLEILIGKIYPNCVILHATDGAQAIEKCRAVPEIELVLMDIQLPVVDGYEAIRQIREFRHHLPIIAQSAYSKVTDINNAKDAGCDDYITKPISLEELYKVLEKYLPVEHKGLYAFNTES